MQDIHQQVEHDKKRRQHQNRPLQDRNIALKYGQIQQRYPEPGQLNTVSTSTEPPSK